MKGEGRHPSDSLAGSARGGQKRSYRMRRYFVFSVVVLVALVMANLLFLTRFF